MTGLLQFTSNIPGRRILDHEFLDGIGDYWFHGGCAAMVMRHGGGDQCGRSYKEHGWAPWVWQGRRFNSADPAGQDFDFDPTHETPTSHNPVNTILLALRRQQDSSYSSLNEFAVEMWFSALESFDAFGGFASWDDENHPYHVILTATGLERFHAHVVLERLISLHEMEVLA